MPAYYFMRPCICDYRQIHKLSIYFKISNITHPQLIGSRWLPLPDQVGILVKPVIGVCCAMGIPISLFAISLFFLCNPARVFSSSSSRCSLLFSSCNCSIVFCFAIPVNLVIFLNCITGLPFFIILTQRLITPGCILYFF